MPYTVGVSSGWWKIDRPPDLLGLATKVGSFGGTSGVQFVQADLDTTSEFFEPRLEEQLKRIKEKLERYCMSFPNSVELLLKILIR